MEEATPGQQEQAVQAAEEQQQARLATESMAPIFCVLFPYLSCVYLFFCLEI